MAEAIEQGRRAVELDPSLASAHGNLGIVLYEAKDYDGAEACHRQALALAPGMPQSLNNLGSIARARKDLAGASDWYRQVLASFPDHLEALSNLGAVLVENDQADAAIPVLEKALSLAPHYPEALCNLGLARFKQERYGSALTLLQRALQLRPGYPEALIGLARTLRAEDRSTEAVALLRQLTAQQPGHAEAWTQLGSLYTEQGAAEAAEAAFQQALASEPQAADALVGLANLHLEAGKIDAAETLLRQAIALQPDHHGARFHLVQAKKVRPGDENLAALEALVTGLSALDPDKRIALHYALGKAYDDLREYDRGFPHFLAGARLKRAKLHYDATADADRCRRIIEIVSHSLLERMAGSGDPSPVPVFVLGMPRSGTTLTEQIIASHPQVHGAGELRDLIEIIQKPEPGRDPRPYPDNLVGLNRDLLAQLGREYVTRLCRRAPAARRITDKMPGNYLALGLIPLMLPQAKIIHVRRNPVDTCVSCFTRLFNRHQDATYDLAELGQHYTHYARLMDHWRQVLPPGAFLEVQYEDIVADMEGQARRLIAYCELEWDDACLAFHRNPRSVRTASVTQVRQPIYTSSVERWRHYEAYLGPLLAALGELAPGRHEGLAARDRTV